jgi:hypothetical protein
VKRDAGKELLDGGSAVAANDKSEAMMHRKVNCAHEAVGQKTVPA